MSRNSFHTVRLERMMKDCIKEVTENHESYNSIKHFSEKAVMGNAGYIESQVEGAADFRELIRALCRVDGISVELPERTFTTKLTDERFKTSTRVEIQPEHLNSIDEIERSTEMSKGDSIRACIIRELYKLSSHSWLLHEPRRSDIQSSWRSLEENIELMFSTLRSQLEIKFVKQWDSTREKIAQDPKAKKDLTAHYQNYFKGSPGHQRLQDAGQGEQILSRLEGLPHGGGDK